LNKVNSKKEILAFITFIRESHSGMIKIFTLGSCMNFHLILKFVFPEAVPYYDCNHIVTRIGDHFYDITGEVDDSGFLPFDSYFTEARRFEVFKQLIIGEYSFQK
jgi:hypothetical protein